MQEFNNFAFEICSFMTSSYMVEAMAIANAVLQKKIQDDEEEVKL